MRRIGRRSPDAPSASIGRRWSRTTIPYAAFRSLGQGGEFLGWILLARRLGAESFGALSVAVLVCRYGGLLADWGASVWGVRHIAAGGPPGAVVALQRRRRHMALAESAVYVVAVVAIGRSEFIPLVGMLFGIGLNRDWMAMGREQGARAAVPLLAQGILFVLLSLVTPVDQPALAAGAAYSIGLVLSLGLNPLPKAAPGAYRVNAWMLLAMVSNQVLSSADVFLVAALASLEDAGIYAAIYRLPNAWLALLVMARSALLPLATQARHGGRAAFLHVRRLSLRWSSVAGVLLAGISPVALWAVPALLGRSYEAGRVPAVVLLLATAVATAAAPLHHLFLAFDDDRPYALCLLVTAIVNVLANLVLIPSLDLIGAAIATVAANVFLAASLYLAVRGRLPTLPADDEDAPR